MLFFYLDVAHVVLITIGVDYQAFLNSKYSVGSELSILFSDIDLGSYTL